MVLATDAIYSLLPATEGPKDPVMICGRKKKRGGGVDLGWKLNLERKVSVYLPWRLVPSIRFFGRLL